MGWLFLLLSIISGITSLHFMEYGHKRLGKDCWGWELMDTDWSLRLKNIVALPCFFIWVFIEVIYPLWKYIL